MAQSCPLGSANLVPRVSHLTTASWSGKMRDPGNEVGVVLDLIHVARSQS